MSDNRETSHPKLTPPRRSAAKMAVVLIAAVGAVTLLVWLAANRHIAWLLVETLLVLLAISVARTSWVDFVVFLLAVPTAAMVGLICHYCLLERAMSLNPVRDIFQGKASAALAYLLFVLLPAVATLFAAWVVGIRFFNRRKRSPPGQ